MSNNAAVRNDNRMDGLPKSVGILSATGKILQVEPITEAHLESMRRQIPEALPIVSLLMLNRRPGMEWVGLIGGKIVGCAGIVPIWSGVGEAWLVVGQLIDQEGVAVARGIRRRIDDAMRRNNLHRLQASVPIIPTSAERLVRVLGFKYEGAMPAYGPNRENYYRYAKVI